MLDLSVFLFESFLQFKVGLSFLFDALLLHVSLDAGVHRLMTQHIRIKVVADKKETWMERH
jgi:hypothetical protein